MTLFLKSWLIYLIGCHLHNNKNNVIWYKGDNDTTAVELFSCRWQCKKEAERLKMSKQEVNSMSVLTPSVSSFSLSFDGHSKVVIYSNRIYIRIHHINYKTFFFFCALNAVIFFPVRCFWRHSLWWSLVRVCGTVCVLVVLLPLLQLITALICHL